MYTPNNNKLYTYTTYESHHTTRYVPPPTPPPPGPPPQPVSYDAGVIFVVMGSTYENASNTSGVMSYVPVPSGFSAAPGIPPRW